MIIGKFILQEGLIWIHNHVFFNGCPTKQHAVLQILPIGERNFNRPFAITNYNRCFNHIAQFAFAVGTGYFSAVYKFG